jgi:hypothetical protein
MMDLTERPRTRAPDAGDTDIAGQPAEHASGPPDPGKRSARMAAGGFGETEQQASEDRTTPDAAASRPERCIVVAVKANGKRAVLLAGVTLAEAESFASSHRPFARAAGGDVVIEQLR